MPQWRPADPLRDVRAEGAVGQNDPLWRGRQPPGMGEQRRAWPRIPHRPYRAVKRASLFDLPVTEKSDEELDEAIRLLEGRMPQQPLMDQRDGEMCRPSGRSRAFRSRESTGFSLAGAPVI